MQLFQKQKNFSKFFPSFMKSRLNFEHFQKQDDPHSFCVSEITDSKSAVRQMSKKCHLRGLFDKQHGKRAQALFKPASHHLYHTH